MIRIRARKSISAPETIATFIENVRLRLLASGSPAVAVRANGVSAHTRNSCHGQRLLEAKADATLCKSVHRWRELYQSERWEASRTTPCPRQCLPPAGSPEFLKPKPLSWGLGRPPLLAAAPHSSRVAVTTLSSGRLHVRGSQVLPFGEGSGSLLWAICASVSKTCE